MRILDGNYVDLIDSDGLYFSATPVTLWYDGNTPMSDSKVDNVTYFKRDGIYLKRNSVITTTGDIIYGSISPVSNSRLPIGSNNQLMVVSSGLPSWRNLLSTDIPSLDTSKITSGTFGNSFLTNYTISGVPLGSTLSTLSSNNTILFSSNYNGSTSSTISLNLSNANSWTSAQTHILNALGGTNTGDILLIQNNTAAALNSQQVSPAIRITNYGWSTTSNQSQSIDWRIYNITYQGSTNPSAQLNFDFSVNGGSFGTKANLSSTGAFSALSFGVAQSAQGTTSKDGFFATNFTSATSGITVQNPTRLRFSGQVWNTSTSITLDSINELRLTSATTPVSSLYWAFQSNNGGYLDRLSLSNTGVLGIYGTTSGIISIGAQSVAGTWNFNLPTTAGTTGQVLTSGGGGSNAMIWSNQEIGGTFTTSSTAQSTFTTTIGTTQSNTTYKIVITAGNLSTAVNYYCTNKTTTTFDIVFTTSITGTVLFDWILLK